MRESRIRNWDQRMKWMDSIERGKVKWRKDGRFSLYCSFEFVIEMEEGMKSN